MLQKDAGPYARGFSGLPDGGAIVCGGDPATKDCEFYDADQNSWRAAPPMNFARTLPVQVLLNDGRVLVAASFTTNPDGGLLLPVPQSEIFW